jgi:ParB-like chromosome segregation protein Spo0J
MKIVKTSPRELRPNPWNTNVVSPENMTKLKASIERFGMFKPVVCRELPDGSLEILGGQHRNEAAIELDMSEIPVANLGPISDAKAKEIGIVDNGRYGNDDAMALAELMQELGTADDLSDFLPYGDAELTAIFSTVDIDVDGLLDDDFDDEEPEEGEIDITPEPAPRTHAIMRFKVPLDDQERIKELIEKTQATHGYTEDDNLTNAGDALVHVLFKGA